MNRDGCGRLVAAAVFVAMLGGASGSRAASSLGLYDGSAAELVAGAQVLLADGGGAAPVPIAVLPSAGLRGRWFAPRWTPHGLWAAPPAVGRGAELVPVSPAVWDPSSGSWFATTAGALVRLDEHGGKRVLVDDVQGRDFDVRAAAQVAVSREPGDRIVLHRFGRAVVERRVLLAGPLFFHPRLSPAGDAVIVAESRATGGHVWLVRLADGVARDLGQGYGATWHPDGARVVFSRIENDGLRVASAELWAWELETGAETRLTATPDFAETRPAISPDGRRVAWVDGRSGALFVGVLAAVREGGRR